MTPAPDDDTDPGAVARTLGTDIPVIGGGPAARALAGDTCPAATP